MLVTLENCKKARLYWLWNMSHLESRFRAPGGSFVSDRFSPFRSLEKNAPGLSGFPVFWEEGSQLALLHGGQPTEHVGEVLGGIDAAALAAHDD